MSKLSPEEEQRILVWKAHHWDILCDVLPEISELLRTIEDEGLLNE